MDQEKTPIRLKGVGKNLCIIVDPTESNEDLIQEITRLLSELKEQVIDGAVTIDVGEGHDELFDTLGTYIKDTYGVSSIIRAEKKNRIVKRSILPEERMRIRDMEQSWHHHSTDVLMLAGRVRSGQRVVAERHLIIMGDVNPGAEVIAGGDVVILGSLMGTAIAGQPENEKNIVFALDFRPTQIQIGSFVAAGLPSSPEKIAEFAHVENGTIVVDNYLEVNPFGRLPWPQVR
ncbi:septum site-determining protein minC [Desulfococcus multivorans DSM 2059]|uniref:Probable septum site-determining protein MinC n=2 Tax=Desulfococcaceae TaxID=2931039 RepID=S7TFE5_DESML|nr:septum site-determining protein minC [Desulfococcus multivorans DSM 2059]SJZ45654.1 septum site-determining protein MinC [Desulfococcus multivorans DSM 2059]